MIGHSLGAHTAGYVAKNIPGIGRITGERRFVNVCRDSERIEARSNAPRLRQNCTLRELHWLRIWSAVELHK